jgi:malonate-semialdehyde dehydrogenase (acetylating)/methylmalonate-semialdehyde dehydrogenase
MRAEAREPSAPGRLDHWVAGRPEAGESTRLGDVFDPATGRCIRKVPLASTADVDRAVRAASEAFVTWSRTPPVVRARVLFRFRELAEARADALAALVTQEHGKVLSDARGELARGMEVVEFACGIPALG